MLTLGISSRGHLRQRAQKKDPSKINRSIDTGNFEAARAGEETSGKGRGRTCFILSEALEVPMDLLRLANDAAGRNPHH